MQPGDRSLASVDERPPLLTVGYGARSLTDFIQLLGKYRIEFLIDVRSSPYSKFKQEFSKEFLQHHVEKAGIRYVFMGDTVGGQPKDPACQTDGKIDYDKVRVQEFFKAGLERLKKAYNSGRRVVLMCSEGRPEQCHRCKLIGEALSVAGVSVSHIDEDGQIITQTQAIDRLTHGQLDFQKEPPQNGDCLSRAREVLKSTFGFSDFLPVQSNVIERVLHGKDALAVMPTGGGKSLCYQLPALIFDGLTVVVSPLIALMQDQVRQLREMGVDAAFLNSTLANSEYVAAANRIRYGGTRILYVAPETLVRPETILLLEQSRLACMAVDEAHCVSEWGHDFRPEYRQLNDLRARFPKAVCLALTATATPRVRKDIRGILGIPAEGEFVASFNRQNLHLAVEPRDDRLAQIIGFLERHRGEAGIVYCGTRKQTDELAASLNANGWPALPYHAGLSPETRRENQDRFIRDDAGLMVATIAFGMGINKPNVRFVIHNSLPKDLESYYQEIGRAGRDGLPAEGLLLYSRADAFLHRRFIDEGAESEREGRSMRLNAMMRYAETLQCRRIPLLGYFDEVFEGHCGNCDICLREEEDAGSKTDVTTEALKFLSCVKRTGEKFGSAHIILVLRGSRSQKVLNWKHDQLSTYGIGKELSEERWRELAREFVRLGLVKQDVEYGVVSITEKGWGVIKGEKVNVVDRSGGAVAPTSVLMEQDPGLFEQLRKLRRELADAAGIPPYVVFSDRTLVEMASAMPQTEEQLLSIHGVGKAKLANHGRKFLRVIQDFCGSNGGEPEPEPAKSIIRPSLRADEIGRAFAGGEEVNGLSSRYGIKRETVIKHLNEFVDGGGALDPERVLKCSALSTEDRDCALAEFERLGIERLAPVHAALSGAISYPELHVLRLYLKCLRKQGR